MSKEKLRYPEKYIQLGFVEWYTKNSGYIEHIDDIEGFKGSPMDSIGFIGDRPILIEFKHVVSAKMVFHADSPAGSIELKIVRALKSLYGKENSCFAEAVACWKKKTAPLIVIVAKSINTRALEKLKHLAKQYASVSWALYEWNGTAGELRYELLVDDMMFNENIPDLPNIKAIAPRRPKGLGMNDVSKLLSSKQLQPVFDAFVDSICKLGGKATPAKYVSNLNFILNDPTNGKPVTVAGVWPHHSNFQNGLLVSYNTINLEQVLGTTKEFFDKLPGVDGPVVGYQNSHRYLRSVEEVNLFWSTLGRSKS